MTLTFLLFDATHPKAVFDVVGRRASRGRSSAPICWCTSVAGHLVPSIADRSIIVFFMIHFESINISRRRLPRAKEISRRFTGGFPTGKLQNRNLTGLGVSRKRFPEHFHGFKIFHDQIKFSVRLHPPAQSQTSLASSPSGKGGPEARISFELDQNLIRCFLRAQKFRADHRRSSKTHLQGPRTASN